MFGEGAKTTFTSLCVPAASYPGHGTTGVAAARSHVQLHSLADRWPKQPGLHPIPGRLRHLARQSQRKQVDSLLNNSYGTATKRSITQRLCQLT
jgi:hypothetical protein